MSAILDKIRKENLRTDLPEFNVGDSIKVFVKIVEGTTERIQLFAGTVIATRGKDMESTFTVRRVTFGQGVERVFPYNSPMIQKIEVVRKGKVRSANIYYLRDKIGKDARVKELRVK